ncbi:MAG: hypothetical protein JO173_06130 [Gammaproteobacteria bacterium]|nr:hypothetical protein [Gammaproteobacteria bacterium]
MRLLALLAGLVLVAWFLHERARVQRARQFNREALDRWEDEGGAAIGAGPLQGSQAAAK